MDTHDALNAEPSQNTPTSAHAEPEIAAVPEPPAHISRNFTTLLALNRVYQNKGAKVYEGTVPPAEIHRRRIRNRRARAARRLSRKQK